MDGMTSWWRGVGDSEFSASTDPGLTCEPTWSSSKIPSARIRIPTWAIKPLRRIRTRPRIKLLHCFCADWVNPAFATCPPKYTAQFLSPAVIRNFAKDPNCDMTEDFLVEALSKGDECFGILDGSTLAAYSWYASQPTRIRPR